MRNAYGYFHHLRIRRSLMNSARRSLYGIRVIHTQHKHRFCSGVLPISGKLDDEVTRTTEYPIIIKKAKKIMLLIFRICQVTGVMATGPKRKGTARVDEKTIEFHPEGLKAESLSILEPTTTAASMELSLQDPQAIS